MKKMIRKIALLAGLLAVVSMTTAACGSKKKDISGTYKGTYDFVDALNKGMSSVDGVDFQLSESVDSDIILVLNEDNTGTLSVDAESFKTNLKKAVNNEANSLLDSVLESQGISKDQYETLAQATGYDSYDAFKQGMIDEVEKSIDDEDYSEMDINLNGKWKLDDNTITLTWDATSVASAGITAEKNTIYQDTATLNDDGTITWDMDPSELASSFSTEDIGRQEVVFTKTDSSDN